MDDLKPCPFCGGEAFVYNNHASCSCGCELGSMFNGDEGMFESDNAAVAAWNRRATPEAETPAVRVKALVWEDQEGLKVAEALIGHYVVWPMYRHVELLIGYGGSSMTRIKRIQLGPDAEELDLIAAAQADYTARILSALEPAPVQGWRTDMENAPDLETVLVSRTSNGGVLGPHVIMAHRDDSEWISEDNYVLDFVSHWQPLPAPVMK